MTTDRLQLTLIPEVCPATQPLPLDVRERSIEIVAMMLVRLVRGAPRNDDEAEVRDESR